MRLALNAVPGVAQARAAFAAGKAWAWVAAVLVLIGFGFYFGNLFGARGKANVEIQLESVKADRNEWRTAADSWKMVSAKWQERNEEDERRRDAQREEAEAILKRLSEMEAQQKAEEQAWRKRFTAAASSPECAELRKVTKCPVFADY